MTLKEEDLSKENGIESLENNVGSIKARCQCCDASHKLMVGNGQLLRDHLVSKYMPSKGKDMPKINGFGSLQNNVGSVGAHCERREEIHKGMVVNNQLLEGHLINK